jgi:FHS family L-fucose permease-like MFS transporter
MQASKTDLRAAFIAVTTLFFAWGFITAMIDPLIPSVKAIFSLSYTQATLTQFAFFMAYGVVSLPGAALVSRVGYGTAVLYALAAMIAGCLIMPMATYAEHYELVLVALFVIASGITVLQVAANPLAAALGPPERSHFRLTLSQAFNSLGTVIAPWIGSRLMLRGGVFADGQGAHSAAVRAESLRSIDTSFLMIAVMIGLLALFIWRSRARFSLAPAAGAEPDAADAADAADAVRAPRGADRAAAPADGAAASRDGSGSRAPDSVFHALRSPWALIGGAAIFLYVGAEVSIGSIMINFLHQGDVLGVSFDEAGQLLSLYWLGAMVGRFVGSVLLTRLRAVRLLTVAALIAAVLCLTVSQGSGLAAAVCAIAVGLVNSIMFPNIFTLTLERSTASAAATSGLLCMAIVGGAVLPPVTGRIADSAGLHAAFLVPMTAYVLISLFAMAAARARVLVVNAPAGEMAH